MTRQARRDAGALAQQKVARKYKLLGYEVLESPRADRLPEFMQGMRPDIVARSALDNVVIEVKPHSALKGANDLVDMAERVSSHPDWRFELVVLDEGKRGRQLGAGPSGDDLFRTVQAAADARLTDMATIYLAQILAMAARDLARRHKVAVRDKADRALFTELGFHGVLPQALVQRCLAVLDRRDDLVHTSNGRELPSMAELKDLLELCEQVRGF